MKVSSEHAIDAAEHYCDQDQNQLKLGHKDKPVEADELQLHPLNRIFLDIVDLRACCHLLLVLEGAGDGEEVLVFIAPTVGHACICSLVVVMLDATEDVEVEAIHIISIDKQSLLSVRRNIEMTGVARAKLHSVFGLFVFEDELLVVIVQFIDKDLKQEYPVDCGPPL